MRRYLALAACVAELIRGGVALADEPIVDSANSRSELSDVTSPPGSVGAELRHLSEVRIESEADGVARVRVVLEFDGAATFEATPVTGGVARLLVQNAHLAANVSGVVDGGSFVTQVRTASDGTRVHLEADVADGTRAYAVRAGHRVLWVFERTRTAALAPLGITVARDRAMAEALESPDVAAFAADAALQVGGTRTSRRYSGRRIDLDFHEADIHNVLRLIAEVGNVNIVTGDDVSGRVTVRMRDVPWDLALETILQARAMGMVRSNNLIRVAPIEVLQAELDARVRALAAARQVTPLETRVIPLSYNAASSMQPQVMRLLTDRGTVTNDTFTNMLIVQDIPEVLENVEALVRVLDRQTPQVLIEARIVEATSQYSRDVGIQWGGDVAMTTATGNPTGIRFPYNVAVAGGNSAGLNAGNTSGLNPFAASTAVPTQNPNFLVNLPAAVGQGAGGGIGLTLGSVGGNVNLNTRLTAAEATGTIRIISSPRILTLNQAEAHISQGTLIPYAQTSALGVNTAWREAKLELRVTPRVSADATVLMNVRITRDEPDFGRTGARGDPTILQREAETVLIVPDGSTAVIGGIYTRTTSRNRRQIPFFGNIPVLGALFRARSVRDERTELLIFLTPRIVNRTEALVQ